MPTMYQLKSGFQGLLRPLTNRLAQAGIKLDVTTGTGCLVNLDGEGVLPGPDVCGVDGECDLIFPAVGCVGVERGVALP